MLAAHKARERSVDQYTKLLQQADPGFSLEAVSQDKVSSHYSILAYTYKKQ